MRMRGRCRGEREKEKEEEKMNESEKLWRETRKASRDVLKQQDVLCTKIIIDLVLYGLTLLKNAESCHKSSWLYFSVLEKRMTVTPL